MTSSFSPTYQRLGSRAEVRSAFDTALEVAGRHISLFDRDGDLYGLNRRQVADAISVFLLKNGLAELELIVHDIGYLQNECARLIPVLRRFSPRFRVLLTDEGIKSYSRGFVVFDQMSVLRRPHFDQSLVFWESSETAVGQAQELLEQLRQQANSALQQVTGL